MDKNQIIQNAINYILEVPSNQPPKVSIAVVQQLQSLLETKERDNG